MSGKILLPRHADKSKQVETSKFWYKIHPGIEIPFNFEIVLQLHNQRKVIGANTYKLKGGMWFFWFLPEFFFYWKKIIVEICVEVM